MLTRLACLALLALHVSAAQYTVLHRFADKNAKFVPRGVVTVENGKTSYEPAAAASSDTDSDSAWYQVAIRVGGEYITTSSPSCLAAADSTLTLHFTGDRPSSVEIKPSGTAKCETSAAPISLPSSALDVRLVHPQVVRSPSLAAAQVVDHSGQKVEPEPEKSFLQKYWMAIVAALLMISVLMGDEAPKQGAGGQAGQPARLATN